MAKDDQGNWLARLDLLEPFTQIGCGHAAAVQRDHFVTRENSSLVRGSIGQHARNSRAPAANAQVQTKICELGRLAGVRSALLRAGSLCVVALVLVLPGFLRWLEVELQPDQLKGIVEFQRFSSSYIARKEIVKLGPGVILNCRKQILAGVPRTVRRGLLIERARDVLCDS